MKSTLPPPLTLQERLILQQAIGNNEPINEQTFIGAHNAYNTAADGYLDPNQRLSTTQMLNAGARALELDLTFDDHVHMCHGGWKILEGSGNYTHTIRDLGKWLDQHPKEVIILQYDDIGVTNAADHVMNPLRTHIGPRLFTPDDYIKHGSHWPSRNEMIEGGKQVILLTQNNPSNYMQPGMKDLAFHGNWNGIFKSDYGTTGRILDFDPTCGQVMNKKLNSFSEVGEDRTHIGYLRGAVENTLNGLISIYNAAKGVAGYSPTAPVRLVAGHITEQAMTDLVRCNVNIIALDMFSFDDARLEKAIWSWDKDNPQPMQTDKSCVSLNHNSRWTNRVDCKAALAVVCKDTQGNWIITEAAIWKEANKICADQGLRFTAPVNGYEQHQLQQKLGAADAWVNAELIRAPMDGSTALHVNNKLAGEITSMNSLPDTISFSAEISTSKKAQPYLPQGETVRTTCEKLPSTIILTALAIHMVKKAFSPEKPEIQATSTVFKKEMGKIRADFITLRKELAHMVINKDDKEAFQFFREGIDEIQKNIARISRDGHASITELQTLKEEIGDFREGRKDFIPEKFSLSMVAASSTSERISYGLHTDRFLIPTTAPMTMAQKTR